MNRPGKHDNGPGLAALASTAVPLRVGRRRRDGAVRYVSHRLHPLVSALLIATVAGSFVAQQLLAAVPAWLPWLTTPVLVGVFLRRGFDVRLESSTIELWLAVGPIHRRLGQAPFREPEVQHTVENAVDAEGSTVTSHVTWLGWNRVRIPTSWNERDLRDAVDEVRRLTRARPTGAR